MKWKFRRKHYLMRGETVANEMNNLVVRLSLDNVNFRQGIANSGRAVRTLQNELKSVSTEWVASQMLVNKRKRK